MRIEEDNDDIISACLLQLISLMSFGFKQQPNPIIINIYTDKKVEIKNDE